MFNFSVLSSGSSGNCVFVETDNTKLLFDAGISLKQIKERLIKVKRDVSTIDSVFVSHEHADHVFGLGVLNRKYNTPILLKKKTLANCEFIIGDVSNVNTCNSKNMYKLGNTTVEQIKTSHDAADPVGFVINHEDKKLGILTDLGVATNSIKKLIPKLDGLVLESNHDVDMLINGRYPGYLKQRIMGSEGHLSNIQAAELIEKHASSKLKYVLLAHLSENNNTPELAMKTFSEIVSKRQDLNSLKVGMTSRFHPTQLINL